MRNHLLIAGTGRAGTSALVKLLDACGLETALRGGKAGEWHEGANAGAETQLLSGEPHPYVVKSPWTYQYIEQILDTADIHIDEVIIPIRRLRSAAVSRIVNEYRNLRDLIPEADSYDRVWTDFGVTAGGVVFSMDILDQERILGRTFHLLVEVLEERDVPYRMLSYPRLAQDDNYAFSKLGHLFPEIREAAFGLVHASVMAPEAARVERELLGPQESPFAQARPDARRLFSLAAQRGPSATELKQALAALPSPTCGDPDEAPGGFSHGDAVIDGDVLQGWHWFTQRRPENDGYGFQLAISDTSELMFIRTLTEGCWRPWRRFSSQDA